MSDIETDYYSKRKIMLETFPFVVGCYEDSKPMREWLGENVGMKWYKNFTLEENKTINAIFGWFQEVDTKNDEWFYNYYFRREEDAIMFALTWC